MKDEHPAEPRVERRAQRRDERPAPAVDPEAARLRLIAARRVHWRRTRTVSAVLLLLWLATGFGTVFYARDLAGLTLFGWPLSFYLAAQGASLIYLAIIGVYALVMAHIDRRFAAALQDPPSQPRPHAD